MTPDRPLTPRRRLLRRLWIGYWILLFTLTHVPIDAAGAIPVPDADKIAHFGCYGLLAYLSGRYWASAERRRTLIRLIGWAVVYAAYGAFDEWLQQFVGRTMSLYDWLANLGGIALGTIVVSRHVREKPETIGTSPTQPGPM